jgi:hypothetical protein
MLCHFVRRRAHYTAYTAPTESDLHYGEAEISRLLATTFFYVDLYTCVDKKNQLDVIFLYSLFLF